MVDLKTAMAAAQAERKKREGSKAAEDKKKRRTGPDLGIEAFDPVKYAKKEKADTASMWLMISYALVVTLLMRYVLMPSTTLDKTDILYLLPLTMIILIPQLHRTVMPERFVEHYTKGTWFRASFLYVFTFLSLSFLLVNPPFGDIVAPELAKDWAIVVESEGSFTYASKDGSLVREWTLEDGQTTTDGAWLLFGLADNVDESGSVITITHQYLNDKNTLTLNDTFWQEHLENLSTWPTADNSSKPKLLPHAGLDHPCAVFLGPNLDAGEHHFTVEITEQGNPWVNVRTYEWTFIIYPGATSTQ